MLIALTLCRSPCREEMATLLHSWACGDHCGLRDPAGSPCRCLCGVLERASLSALKLPLPVPHRFSSRHSDGRPRGRRRLAGARTPSCMPSAIMGRSAALPAPRRSTRGIKIPHFTSHLIVGGAPICEWQAGSSASLERGVHRRRPTAAAEGGWRQAAEPRHSMGSLWFKLQPSGSFEGCYKSKQCTETRRGPGEEGRQEGRAQPRAGAAPLVPRAERAPRAAAPSRAEGEGAAAPSPRSAASLALRRRPRARAAIPRFLYGRRDDEERRARMQGCISRLRMHTCTCTRVCHAYE